MLEKILYIRNVGPFRDCAPKGDVQFRRLSLIFGENGRGKTTLCDILRSLQTGEAALLHARKTTDVTEDPQIQFRLDGDTATFGVNGWTKTCPNLAIFDMTYVHQNVYAGDHIEHEHRKNLYGVIVGAQGVQLAKQVAELDGELRAATKEVATKTQVLDAYLPPGMKRDTFLNLPADADLDGKIQASESQVAALKQAGQITSTASLSALTLPILPADFVTLLSKQLADISTDAESQVRRHLKEHTKDGTEPWLAQGLNYVLDEQCPFCARPLQGVDLFTAFRGYFSDSYENFKAELITMRNSVDRLASRETLLSVQKVISDNEARLTFWNTFCPLVLPVLDFDSVRDALDGLRRSALILLDKKIATPLESIQASAELSDAIRSLDQIAQRATAYNDAITKSNVLITQQKAKATAGNLGAAQQQLATLHATKRRREPAIQVACLAYTEALVARATVELKKDQTKQQLDTYTATIFGAYQHGINRYLARFGAGFRITNTSHSYKGGSASSSFQIEINQVAIDLGDSTTPIDQPCFRNTLSGGDRSALALAFFFVQLDRDPNLAGTIVVFDDPFTSQDANRRFCTSQSIANYAAKTLQVVVLSHNPDFLKTIWDQVDGATVHTMQMTRIGSAATTITEWDIQQATEGQYLHDYRVLSDYSCDGKGDAKSVVRVIRPMLEAYLRLKFPHRFEEHEWLGEFIAKIRIADATSPLSNAQPILSELEAINDYAKQYHHSNPNHETVPVVEGEVSAYVDRALAVVCG